MRVVGGKLRSRPIAGPKSDAVRPTSDRLREALFNILTHSYGDPVTGARVLDLFAGTGALGIEAISRGADYALFVDEGVEARALLRDNVESLGLGGVTRIFRRDASKLGPAHPLDPFSLVFLDPPYGKGPRGKVADFRARRRVADAGSPVGRGGSGRCRVQDARGIC
jgi:16S rRNA (guanine966-N2)-methyltransferase